jgi:acetyl esterase
MIELARRASARNDRVMSTNEAQSAPGIRRVADLRLRGAAESIPVRVCWPRSAAADPAPSLVLLLPDAAGDQLALELCAELDAVVLRVDWARSLDRAEAALTWIGDHGAELGGDPARLVIAGRGTGAAAAVALASLARNRGWPSIARVLAIPDGADEEDR